MLSGGDFKNARAYSATHKGGTLVLFMKCSASVASQFGNWGIKSPREVSR